MKNKIALLSLGVLALGVAGFSGFATLQFANYGKELLANVFDRQTSTPSYGEPWQDRYRLSACALYQDQVKGWGDKAVHTVKKVEDLHCDKLQQEIGKHMDGKYFVQSTYFNNIPMLFGFLLRGADLNVVSPIVVSEGKYSCDFDAQGWKSVYTAMPYGRLGLVPTASAVEPRVHTYVAGSDTTLILEETKDNQTIPHDLNVCPVVGKLNGPNVKDGDVRLNWGFVSLKNMNMLVIQPESISYYDASGNKVKNFADGSYILSFPDIYKDYQIQLDVKGKTVKVLPDSTKK
jgi:hypothetical protein